MTAITASTKRSVLTGGKYPTATTKLASLPLAMVPIPADPETVERYKLQSPRKVFVCGFFGTYDVIEADILTTGGIDYHVRAASKYTSPVNYTELILETVK